MIYTMNGRLYFFIDCKYNTIFILINNELDTLIIFTTII